VKARPKFQQSSDPASISTRPLVGAMTQLMSLRTCSSRPRCGRSVRRSRPARSRTTHPAEPTIDQPSWVSHCALAMPRNFSERTGAICSQAITFADTLKTDNRFHPQTCFLDGFSRTIIISASRCWQCGQGLASGLLQSQRPVRDARREAGASPLINQIRELVRYREAIRALVAGLESGIATPSWVCCGACSARCS
jgi:hypothetical protein